MLSVSHCARRSLTSLLLLSFSMALAIAGCGGGSSGGSSFHAAATDPTSTSVIAVDCSRQRGYVPLPNLNSSLHGQVAVLDLAVDPDSKNPLVKIIDIGITALPRSVAADFKSGTVYVPADNGATTGTMVLIDESDDSVTTVPFPTGSRPAETSGVVADPNGTALVSMEDGLDCPSALGGCDRSSHFQSPLAQFRSR